MNKVAYTLGLVGGILTAITPAAGLVMLAGATAILTASAVRSIRSVRA